MTHPTGFDNGGYRKFGMTKDGFHVGTDLNCPLGTVVRAMAGGTVMEQTGQHSGYGALHPNKSGGVIFIKHTRTISQYGHVYIDPKVISGKTVEEGQIIGTIAPFKNGGVLLPHLHFGIWEGLSLPPNHWGYVKDSAHKGHWVNPLLWHFNH